MGTFLPSEIQVIQNDEEGGSPFSVGDRVSWHYRLKRTRKNGSKKSKNAAGGTVAAVNGDGSINVTFDDGSYQGKLPTNWATKKEAPAKRRRIRRGSKIRKSKNPDAAHSSRSKNESNSKSKSSSSSKSKSSSSSKRQISSSSKRKSAPSSKSKKGSDVPRGAL